MLARYQAGSAMLVTADHRGGVMQVSGRSVAGRFGINPIRRALMAAVN